MSRKRSKRNSTERFKNRIIGVLRKLTWSWEPYRLKKESAKVDSATYQCEKCGKYCYTGKSHTNFLQLQQKYDNIVMEGIDIDHIEPVIDPNVGFIDWNTYMDRLFCEEDGLQALCKDCHKIKTKEENNIRKI